MLVDVVELDWHEHPRDLEEVLAQVPVRGLVDVDRLWSDQSLDRAPSHADLKPMKLETLYSARMVRWKGLNVLLSGWQRQPAKGRQTGGAKFPQRWWLHIVLDPSAPPLSWNQRQETRRAAGQPPSRRPNWHAG